MEILIDLTVPSIDAVVANHFKILLRDVLHQELNEFNSRYGFLYIDIIFMPIVMKSDSIINRIIGINTAGGNYRTTEITADIFCYLLRVSKSGLGINVKAFVMNFVHLSFDRFERRTNSFFEIVQ